MAASETTMSAGTPRNMPWLIYEIDSHYLPHSLKLEYASQAPILFDIQEHAIPIVIMRIISLFPITPITSLFYITPIISTK